MPNGLETGLIHQIDLCKTLDSRNAQKLRTQYSKRHTLTTVDFKQQR